jgi:hypothetical protein
MTRETTGPHPLPPLADPHRGSEPPISARGVSWKVVLAFLSALWAVGGLTGTVIYTHAESQADDRARDVREREFRREVIARLDRIETSSVTSVQRLGEHGTVIAVLRRDVDAHDRELETLKRRSFRRRETP